MVVSGRETVGVGGEKKLLWLATGVGMVAQRIDLFLWKENLPAILSHQPTPSSPQGLLIHTPPPNSEPPRAIMAHRALFLLLMNVLLFAELNVGADT